MTLWGLFQFYQFKNEFDKRTLKCDLLESGPYALYSKEFGINYRSSLLSLQYVNVCSGMTVSDVTHNVLEGVLEMKLLLHHFTQEKSYFRVTTLETLMESYEFGYMEVANHLTPIDSVFLCGKDNSLKQNGIVYFLC